MSNLEKYGMKELSIMEKFSQSTLLKIYLIRIDFI